MRSTVSLNVVEDRSDYRSLKGLTELREQMGVSRPGRSDTIDTDEPESPSPKAPPPTALAKRTKVAGGFHLGDRVSSLISRVRGGLLVLELGHEGTIMGCLGGRGSDGPEAHLLIQFDKGFDWCLPVGQVCLTAQLAAAKGKGSWVTALRGTPLAVATSLAANATPLASAAAQVVAAVDAVFAVLMPLASLSLCSFRSPCLLCSCTGPPPMRALTSINCGPVDVYLHST